MPLVAGRRSALAGAAALALAAPLANPGFHHIRVGGFTATLNCAGFAGGR